MPVTDITHDLDARTITIVADFAGWALPRFEDGRLRPIVDTVLDLERVADAHRLVEADRAVGKVVLRVP